MDTIILSVATSLILILLSGNIWFVRKVISQGDTNTWDISSINTKLAVLSQQLEQFKVAVCSYPELSTKVAVLENTIKRGKIHHD